ncbi:hypothetical protein JQV19_09070 [Sulfitobacter mediterraneus]|uniref:hypothetical protein n=1 Tax=Sulfitobacter mediterraneus TaxID=83219 RepID=UPI00193A0C99|nr:hypothetical protein [Sulfitobacter mediterraneus]MBM1556798.1 hypothetical protein [Sulfitobacter mediterraneus]MBM1568983.1 hypothetical protein [Sulfitobacter mediterraneus]MBM1572410.1 hypothetical protein [Sulfitobacter mediterraneus]MBM1576573.1 hypothetical protein [Sulfitobacter mediterraneus]MBM1579756.1 hypothetical protein [Sulfitobacter mediterraneus]
MNHSLLTGLWFLGIATILTSCGFDGDQLREYLPSEIADAPSIYNERDIFICAVSIYQLEDGPPYTEMPFSKPTRSTSDWLQLPLEGKVDYGSFAAQALSYGNECFDSEAQKITGLRILLEYYSSNRKGYFIEVRHDLILVHDTERRLIIISSR